MPKNENTLTILWRSNGSIKNNMAIILMGKVSIYIYVGISIKVRLFHEQTTP